MKKVLKYILLAFAAMMALGMVLVIIGTILDDGTAPPLKAKAEPLCTEEHAVYAAWGAVRNHLKNDRSAEFGDVSKAVVVGDGNGTYMVRSFVRATNSFNAVVKTDFLATVSCDSVTGKWREVTVQFAQ